MSTQNITPKKQNQKTVDFRTKYKTQKCRFWFQKGFCPFNKFCAFAHAQQEIREKHELNLKYKTKSCINFFTNGFCKYGDRCQYLHTSFVSIPDGEKTRSNSEQSYRSKSTTEEKPRNKNLNRGQFKNQNRLQMLEKTDITLFNIMMGGNSKINLIMSSGMQHDEVEYYRGLGNSQQKKLRMYSM